MNAYVLAGSVFGLFGLLSLSVRMKILAAMFIMTQCFDLAPSLIFGQNIWDYGAALLLVAAVQLMFKKKTEPINDPAFIIVLRIFTAWLIICLLYSLFIYGYPVLDTFKVARQMIIGYLALFVFLRLFTIDKDAFDVFMKWIYVATFLLLIVAIVQYILGTPLLFGLHQEYGSVTRYLPSYLPLSLVFLWFILSRYFSAELVKKHEYVYVAMVVFVTAVTFTRGLYLAVMLAFLAMLFLLIKVNKVKASPAIKFIGVFIIGIVVLTASGALDRVIGRAASGIGIIFSGSSGDEEIDADTFTGRLLLVKERFELVAVLNPAVGLGFAHQNNLPKSLVNSLKYGSVVRTPELRKQYAYGAPLVLALFSVDVGWGNIVVATGYVGFFIFSVFIIAFLMSFRSSRIDDARLYHLHLAFYLQTIVLLLLMFNGSPFTYHVQLASLIIAGYVYCGNVGRNAKPDDKPSVSAEKSSNILCRKKSLS